MNEERRCPSCGEPVKPGASNCDNCGRSLSDLDFASESSDEKSINEEIKEEMPSGLSSLGDMIEKKVMASVKKREEQIRESMKKDIMEREKEIREEMQQRMEKLREEHKEERSELLDKIDKEKEEKEEMRKELEEKNEELREKIDKLKEEHKEEKTELREEYEGKIEDLNEKISNLKDKHMEEKEGLRERLNEEKEELRNKHEQEVNEFQEKLEDARERLEDKERESKEKLEEVREKLKKEKEELSERLNEEKEELKYDMEREKVNIKNRLNERIDELQERLKEEKEKSKGMDQLSMQGADLELKGGLTEEVESKLKEPVYPFPAIVGQERMKRALLLNVINPSINGVLIWGEKGSGKRTAMVGIAELVAGIEDVKEKEEEDIKVWNDEDRYIAKNIHTHKTNSHMMLDTVLGNGSMTIKGEKNSQNTDTPMVTVKNLTPADRYMFSYMDTLDLHVRCDMIEDLDKRREIIKRKRAYEEDPEGFYKEYEEQIHDLRDRIVKTRQTMPSVTVSSRQRNTISNLSAHASLSSGTDILLEEVSRTLSAYDGREEITDEDIQESVDLMFSSRIKDELMEEI